MPALSSSFLLRVVFIRGMTWFFRGRLAIAAGVSDPTTRPSRIAEARRMARNLMREHDPWLPALGQLVLAAAENAAGRRAAAIDALRAAIAGLEATETRLYLLPARYRLGQLLGGSEGERVEKDAVRACAALSVVSPERWLSMYLPGTWSSAPPLSRTA
jgi:hypothetical protein